MYPFERFSEMAKAVLLLAQEEAERAHHSYIGTEHLLLGLLRAVDCSAARVLADLGIEIEDVRRTIQAVLGRNERTIVQRIIPTSRVKKVIEIAFEESRRLNDGYVGTHHLLLGIVIEGEGIAAHVLQDLGAGADRIRAQVGRLPAGETERGAEVPGRPPRYQVGQRVLVHDPDPPHRLWEGRVTKEDGDGWEIAIADRPAGEVLLAQPDFLHTVPMTWDRDCAFCRSDPGP
jgi:ATP-dependent Clp protease ATP-binding subunit ClpA